MGLAHQCGFPHIRPMLDAYDLTDDELAEIEVFGKRYGTPVRRIERAVGLLAYVLSLDTDKTVTKYLDGFDAEAERVPEREQTPEEMEASFRLIGATVTGGAAKAA